MMMQHAASIALAAATLAIGMSTGAHAEYPEKDVQYIIPFGPGGESDISARLQQSFFKELTGEELVIQYKPGGGGAVAWSQLNDMPADGYTIMGTNLPHTILKPMAKDVGFTTDQIETFYFFHYSPDAIVVREDSRFKSFQDLLNATKESPGSVTFSGSGTYTANHVANTRFNELADVTTTYIPFKGTGAAVTALLGEQVDAEWGYTTVAANHKDKTRLLAIAAEERHPLFPDVPTFKELGIDMVGGAYRGIAVPKDTPEEKKKRLSELFSQINNDPEFQKKMKDLGFALIDVTREEVDAFMKERRAEYSKVAREFDLLD